LRNGPYSSPPKRILVVDDHQGTREAACAVLQKAGFTVSACASGEEGLLTIARDPSIGLLITDIVMPGRLNGWRLAESSKALRESLRVIYITAVPSVVPRPGQGPGLGPLVPKPCTPAQLIASVQRVLGLSPGPRRRT
jgi:DNA-binding NtrC family response regulator